MDSYPRPSMCSLMQGGWIDQQHLVVDVLVVLLQLGADLKEHFMLVPSPPSEDLDSFVSTTSLQMLCNCQKTEYERTHHHSPGALLSHRLHQ